MKTTWVKKVLVVEIICIFILATSPMIYARNESNYNLKIQIRPWNKPTIWGFQFLFNHHDLNVTYHVDVSNEGPDDCNNYSLIIDVIFLFSTGSLLKDWFYHFDSWEYEGSLIESGDVCSIEKPVQNGGTGIWMAKATIISEDANKEDNLAKCFFIVT